MRNWILLGIVMAWLVPATAGAQPVGSAECRYLTTQIDFFESRTERARELGNAVWESRLEAHLDRLTTRRADRCPGYGDGDQAMEAFNQLVELAARGALTFFTMGAF